ncbi:MAG: conjugative transposon protein TraM, partial [Chitinophagaceae bacterium]|nr:conjugative transposon protein TraM [Chitinophagaceae bacterium]
SSAIKAKALKNAKVTENELVSFSTTETYASDSFFIPRNTQLAAIAKFDNNRVYFDVNKILIDRTVYNVQLIAVDADLNDGLVYRPAGKKKFYNIKQGDNFKFVIKPDSTASE